MSGNKGTQTQTVVSDPWSGQQPYLKDLFSQAQDLYNQGAPDSATSQSALRSYIDSLRTSQESLAPTISSAANASQFLMNDALRPESNPALQEYINLSNKSITDSFTQNVLPSMTSQTAAVGGVGSSRQGIMEALSSQNLMDTLQRNTSQLTSQGYQSGLDAMTKGLALAPQTAAMGMMPADIDRMIYGGTQEGEMMDPMRQAQWLQLYQNAIGGNLGGTQTSTTPTSSGGLAGALGGGLSGAGIAGALPASMAAWNPWIIGAGALLGFLS